MLDPPHTQDNYLLTEMGYRVARKHAGKLRRLAVISGLLLPVALLPVAAVAGGMAAFAMALAAAIAGSAGVVIERWLFFAEAQHTVTLYYGAKAA
jgi:DMSO reductase anchor subunit